MKILGGILFAFLLMCSGASAYAHQPVNLKSSDRTPDTGPLLVDGTISFAVTMKFSKAKQVRAFRAGFNQGDTLALQLLIYDEKPERNLKNRELPVVRVISPSGRTFTLPITERTAFYEPWGKRNYLYLGRSSQRVDQGIYSFEITSRAPGRFIIAIGEREVPGEVERN